MTITGGSIFYGIFASYDEVYNLVKKLKMKVKANNQDELSNLMYSLERDELEDSPFHGTDLSIKVVSHDLATSLLEEGLVESKSKSKRLVVVGVELASFSFEMATLGKAIRFRSEEELNNAFDILKGTTLYKRERKQLAIPDDCACCS